jgi:hypothetical protein
MSLRYNIALLQTQRIDLREAKNITPYGKKCAS